MAPTIFATYPTNVIQYSRLNFAFYVNTFFPEMIRGAILLYLIYLKQIYK